MAGSINKVILVGRMGQDAKLSYMPSGQAVAEFSVATDESYKDREGNKVEKTEWHKVKTFGKTAEFCNNYLGKGRLVYVEGKIQTRSWDDQQGQKRYVTEINAMVVQGLDSRQQGQGTDQPAERPHPRQASGGRRHEDNQGPAFPSEASGLDDIPF